MEKHCSNRQCFKEKNYKAKFSTSSIIIKNKIDKYNFFKKKKKRKKKKIILKKNKKKKKHVGNGKKKTCGE
jgi:hypothetical protein